MPYVKNPNGSIKWVPGEAENAVLLSQPGQQPQWQDLEYTELPGEERPPENLGLYAGDPKGPYQPASEFSTPEQYDYQNQPDVLQLYQYLDRKRRDSLSKGDNEAADKYEQVMETFEPEEGIAKYGRRIPKYDQEYFISKTVGQHAREVRMKLEREEEAEDQRFLKKQINGKVTNNSKLRKLFSEAIRKGFTSFKALKGNTQSAWGAELSRLTQNWSREHAYEFSVAAEALFDQLAVHHAKGTIPEVAEDAERGKDVYRQKGYSDQEIAEVDDVSLITTGRDARGQFEAQQAEEQAAEEARVRESRQIAQTDTFVQRRVGQESDLGERPTEKGYWTEVVGPGGTSRWQSKETEKEYSARLNSWRKSQSHRPIFLLQKMLRATQGRVPSTSEIISNINSLRAADALPPFPFEADDPQTQALLQGLVDKAQQWNQEESQKGIEYRNIMLEAQQLAVQSEKQHRIFSLRTGGTEQQYKDEALRLRHEALDSLSAAEKDFDELLRPRLEGANRMDAIRNWEDVFGAARFQVHKTTYQENTEDLHYAKESPIGDALEYWLPDKYKGNKGQGTETPVFTNDPSFAASSNMMLKANAGKDLADWYDRYYLPSRKDSPLARAIADIGLIPVSWAQSGGNMAAQGVGGLLQIAGVPGSAEFNRGFVKLNQRISAAYDKLTIDAWGEEFGGQLNTARSGLASLAAILGVNLVTGGAGGMVTVSAMFWGSSFAESYVEAKDQGKSGTEAYVYGNIMGFAEVAPMMLGAKWLKMPGMLKYLKGIGAVEGGALTNAAKTGLQSAIRRWAGYMSKDLLKSMGEESFQELLTLAIGRLTQGAMGIQTFENSMEGWLEQITEVLTATAYSMGFGQAMSSGGVFKRQQQQLENAAAAGQIVTKNIDPTTGRIKDDTNSLVSVASAVRDNLEAFTAFIAKPSRSNAEKLGIPLPKESNRQTLADEISPVVDFHKTEINNAEENAKRRDKGQEPLPNTANVTFEVDTGEKDSEGKPISRVVAIPVRVDPNTPAGEQQEAAEEKASQHDKIDGKPAKVVPKSDTHQKTTVTVQDEAGNEQDLTVYVPRSRITEGQTAEDIATGDLESGVEIEGERFSPVGTKPVEETVAPRDPSPATRWVEPEESIEDIEAEAQAGTGQVDPEAPSGYTGAGVGSPVDQQVAEQEQQPEVEEDVEEAPIEDGPTTSTQQQFRIQGVDPTGEERTITVWAEDENDAYAIGKDQGVVGTQIRKTKEKNTFQEEDVVEDDTQQEEQPAPEEQPSSTSTDSSVVEQYINDEAERRGMTPQELADEIGESLGLPTKGDSVEGAAARIANNNKDDSERDATIDEQLDAVGKEASTEATPEPAPQPTPEEFSQVDEFGGTRDRTVLEGTPWKTGGVYDSLEAYGTRPKLKRDASGNPVETTREDNSWRVSVYWKPSAKESAETSFGFDSEADAKAAAEAVRGLSRKEQVEKLTAMKAGKIPIPTTPTKAIPEVAPEATPTQEESPQYDEQGFDQDGVTEDGRIKNPDMLVLGKGFDTMTVEEAEAKEEELRKYDSDAPYDKIEADIDLADKLRKQIKIAKQKQGKTAEAASETTPTQEATQEKSGPDSRTWTPEEEAQKVQQGLNFLNKRNKQRRKNARPAKVVQPTTKEGQRAVELADSLGVKLVFVDNMIGAGGMAFEQDGEMTGVIFVKKGKEGDALFQVVFHELAHGTGIDKIDLGLTEAEMDDLLHEYLSRASKSHQAEIRKQFEENPELARREAVATLMGRIATDPDFRAAYAKDNPTTFGKIVDAILEFFNLHPEAKLSKAQKNLLSELRNLNQKKTVEPAATFESSLENALDLSPEEVRQEAKKRKLPVGGQSTEAQREAVADDMHRESLADSVELDPDIITERVQDNLKGKKLEDPGDFTADDFDVLEQIEDDSTEAAPKKKGRRRKRVKSTGQYVGAPKGIDTPSKLRTMMKKVENLVREGEFGRFWYERSSQQILDLVKGDKAEAEKLVMAIAITSSSTPVGMNFDFALQAYNQWKAGKPITTGRFPKAMGPKLQAAFEGTPWEGIKTNHFYTNLMRRIDPSKVQGVTHDIWMMRAFGFMGDSPTAAQYDFGLKEVQAIADKLGWEPQQVQAAAWVAMKAKMENSDVKKATEAESVKKGFMTYVTNKNGQKIRKILNAEEHRKLWFKHANQHTATEADKEKAKFDYKDASEKRMAQISWETKPGSTTNHFPELFDAPYEQQVEYHTAMSQAMLDDNGVDIIAKRLGVLSPGDFEAPGYFEGELSPGTQTQAVVPSQFKNPGQLDPSAATAVDVYCAVRGILLKQDAVAWNRPFHNAKVRDQNMVDVRIGRQLTEAETVKLAELIAEESGISEYNPIITPEGARLLNTAEGVDNKRFHSIIDNALKKMVFENNESYDAGRAAFDGNYISNEWGENQNGEGYLAHIATGRPDLLGEARDLIKELHEKTEAVEDEFAQKYGWTKNEEIGIPQEKSLEQVDNETADAARKTTEMHEKFLQKVRILITGGMQMDEAIQQITDEYIEASVKAGIHRDVAASRAVKAMGAVRGALGRGASKNASTVNIGVENVPITVSSANSVLQQLLESHESETQLIHPDPHAQMSQFRDAINLVGDDVSQLLEQAEAISLSPAQAKIRLGSQQQAIMTLAINYIQMELRADAKRLSRAKPGSPEARNIAARQVQNLETLERFVLGNQRLGTETARALQLRQGKNLFDNLDLDPIEVLAIATEMKGKPLTPEEKAEINKTVKDQKARAAKAKAAREKVDQAQAESTFNKEKKRPILGKDGKPKKVNTKANVAQIKKLLDEGC